jgi:hypothetical protein
MKKYILLTALLALSAILTAISTGPAVPLANSYLQRATGVEANYWNPANINRQNLNNAPAFNDSIAVADLIKRTKKANRQEILFVPVQLKIENDILSLNLYNSFAGQQITDDKKNQIINSIDKNITLAFDNSIQMGYRRNRVAFSTSSHIKLKARLDKQLAEVINGNRFIFKEDEKTEDNIHVFNHDNNNVQALAYQDITLGFGSYSVNNGFKSLFKNIEIDQFPTIYFGTTFSYLLGYGHAATKEFNGILEMGDEDGIFFDQRVVTNHAILGNGFKAGFGFSTEDILINEKQSFSIGLSWDNLFGQIKWNGTTESTTYMATIDNVHALDAEDDILVEHSETIEIDPYTIKLPTIFRFGIHYNYNDLSASFDISKTNGMAKLYSQDPEISIAIQHPLYWKWLQGQFGYRIPNGENQAVYAFGLKGDWRKFETGFGYQSFDAFFNDKAKGVMLSYYTKWKF